MTKLYYSASSCSAASFIAAYTAKVSIECELVDTKTHLTSSGVDFYTINPKGNVPTLVLDDGTVLNEGAAVLQWTADQAPGTIAAQYGTNERYLIQQAVNYVGSEVHTSIGGLFRANTDTVRSHVAEGAHRRLKYLNDVYLANHKFLVGDKFSIADAYLYIVLSWSVNVKIDLSHYPAVQDYYHYIGNLSNVIGAHERILTNPATTY
mmetsp:Transcript_19205/g.17423  ORF Transcript_19205/g.17423 Transcript_19205/m.17423 type:complete len:207 (-) Transcript_19205:80-700(-)